MRSIIKQVIFLFQLLWVVNIFGIDISGVDFNVTSGKFEAFTITEDTPLELIGDEAYNFRLLNQACPSSVPSGACLTSRTFLPVLSPYHFVLKEFYQFFKQYSDHPTPEGEKLLYAKAEHIRDVIMATSFPEDLLIPLSQLYATLSQGGRKALNICDSVAIGELHRGPFSESLNKLDFASLIKSIKVSWAAAFSDGAIQHYLENGVDVEEIGIGVLIQEVVDAHVTGSVKVENGKIISRDRRSSFSLELENAEKDLVFEKLCQSYEPFSKGSIDVQLAFDVQNKLYLLRSHPSVPGQVLIGKKSGLIKPAQEYTIKKFKDKAFARIAVFGIVLYQDKVLFLKQNDERYHCYWRPPGGGVRRGEDLFEALKREIKEDTSLDVNVIRLVDAWKGPHGIDGSVVSLTYVCEATSSVVGLSDEYSRCQWVPVQELDRYSMETAYDLSNWSTYVKESFAKRIE